MKAKAIAQRLTFVQNIKMKTLVYFKGDFIKLAIGLTSLQPVTTVISRVDVLESK